MSHYRPHSYATVLDEGVPLARRSGIDFRGAGVTVTDDDPNGATRVTIAGAGAGAFPLTLMAHATTWTNLPAALTELSAAGATAPRNRAKTDLSAMTQGRVTVYVGLAGSAGTGVRLQYSSDEATWTYLDGATGPEAIIDTTGTKVSAWVTLAAGARADVFLRAIAINGDGVADPQLGTVTAQFRAA